MNNNAEIKEAYGTFNIPLRVETLVPDTTYSLIVSAFYTVNDVRNTLLYERYRKVAKLKFPTMIFCGRLGDYKYYDMDDAIKRALLL